MTATNTLPNLAERCLAVTEQVGSIGKDGRNAAQKFDYASAENVFLNINAACIKHRVRVYTDVLPTSILHEPYQLGSGSTWLRSSFVTRLVAVNIDDPTDRDECFYVGLGVDGGDKGAFKGETAAAKYAELRYFNLPTGEEEPDSIQPPEMAARPAAYSKPATAARTTSSAPATAAPAARKASATSNGTWDGNEFAEIGKFKGTNTPWSLVDDGYLEFVTKGDKPNAKALLEIARRAEDAPFEAHEASYDSFLGEEIPF